MQGLINSLIIASAATVLSTVIGTMMAYSLARFNTGGQHLALLGAVATLPPAGGHRAADLSPFSDVGALRHPYGLILAYTFMTLPLSVWMMFAYFKQLPQVARGSGVGRRLEPLANLLDGRRLRSLRPAVAAAAVFVFIAVWTEFFFALILTSRHAFTLPTIFRAFLGFQGAQYGEACALATTSLVPSIVLGMLVQRHLVRGLTLGAIRG